MKKYSGAIISRSDGKFLFQLRSKNDDNYPRKWGIFGGHLRKGENPLAGIKRELNEELGLRNFNPRLAYSFWTPNRYFYVYDLSISRNIRLRLSDGDAYGWFTRKELLFKSDVVPVIRLLMLFYPLIHWWNKK
jgi:8-oxo-dGTP diphosphatase